MAWAISCAAFRPCSAAPARFRAGARGFFGGAGDLLAGFAGLLQGRQRLRRALGNFLDAADDEFAILGDQFQVGGRCFGLLHFLARLVPGQLDIVGDFRDLRLDVLHQVLDPVGVFAALVGQRANVAGHHGEASAIFPGARSFHVAVDCQHLRLHRDHHDRIHDLVDAPRALFQFQDILGRFDAMRPPPCRC